MIVADHISETLDMSGPNTEVLVGTLTEMAEMMLLDMI